MKKMIQWKENLWRMISSKHRKDCVLFQIAVLIKMLQFLSNDL